MMASRLAKKEKALHASDSPSPAYYVLLNNSLINSNNSSKICDHRYSSYNY